MGKMAFGQKLRMTLVQDKCYQNKSCLGEMSSEQKFFRRNVISTKVVRRNVITTKVARRNVVRTKVYRTIIV